MHLYKMLFTLKEVVREFSCTLKVFVDQELNCIRHSCKVAISMYRHMRITLVQYQFYDILV